ncbi:MAG: glycosyltransferase family 2 protein, partial [Ignavibacteriaceae bacterium]|nr:glycosyltransferase family 2 protein [Ignavibacteriaceae bacterium]
MAEKQEIKRSMVVFEDHEYSEKAEDKEKKYLKRIFIFGSISLLLILVIIYTLPKTVLTLSSLAEYTTIVAMVIFLFILLIRYFGILIAAYLYINQYTFSSPGGGYFPFVSILVPVYNEDKVIADSINSLLELNYPNYEIIIINDGSTDKTKQVAETLVGYKKGKVSEVKVTLINKPNGGKAKALNTGIKYSKAEIVLCMDGDSQLSPDCVKLAVRHFSNREIGAVAGNVKV